MKLWGDKAEPVEPDAEPQERADPMQAMILGMVAKNPALQQAFGGIQSMLQGFVDTANRIEVQNTQILEGQQTILALLGATPKAKPNITGQGVINDGTRCIYCDSRGDHLPDCPGLSDDAFTRPGPELGPLVIADSRDSTGGGGRDDGSPADPRGEG